VEVLEVFVFLERQHTAGLLEVAVDRNNASLIRVMYARESHLVQANPHTEDERYTS
jgi:hypothetical protein